MKDIEFDQIVADVTAEAERIRREQLVREFGEERADELMIERQPGCTRIVLDGEKDEYDQTFAFACNGPWNIGGR